MHESSEHDGPPAQAARSIVRTRVDEFPADAFRGISESNARFIFAGAVLIIFVGVFIADILAAKPYWHDRHDVEDTFAPFLTLVAGAVGSAVTFYFTDRHRR